MSGDLLHMHVGTKLKRSQKHLHNAKVLPKHGCFSSIGCWKVSLFLSLHFLSPEEALEAGTCCGFPADSRGWVHPERTLCSMEFPSSKPSVMPLVIVLWLCVFGIFFATESCVLELSIRVNGLILEILGYLVSSARLT